MTLIIFGLVRLSGDPRVLLLDEYATIEEWNTVGQQLGLDRPLVVQYGVFLGNLARADLGKSLRTKRPVTEIILERLPATLQLAGVAYVFALAIAIPAGVLAATKRDTFMDGGAKVFAMLGQSLPPFWVGIIFILFFAVILEALPAGGRESPRSLILPAFTLGWYFAAVLLRLLRSSMLEVLDSEYIKMARAKGTPEWLVIWRDAMKNALLAPLTFAGIVLAHLITGSVTVETVFGWPGAGLLVMQAITERDYSVVQGLAVAFTLLYIGMSLAVDILYGFLDPRIRRA